MNTPAVDEIERYREKSRDRVLRALRGAAPSGRWQSWHILQSVCGHRYLRAIHELGAQGYIIERRPSQTQRTGNDYLLTGEPGPQVPLPLATGPKQTKSARRAAERTRAEIAAEVRAMGGGIFPAELIAQRIEGRR
jgi:hypothetical protein